MAGGKETPRQKMIGMMYLVLTALLALNVSKEIINAFVKLDKKLMESNAILLNQGDEIMWQFSKAMAIKENIPIVEPWLKVAEEVRKVAFEMDQFINIDCKNELIKAVEKKDWIYPDDNGKKAEGEKNWFTAPRFIVEDPMEIQTKDDYDAATRLFGGAKGTPGYNKGGEIREKIHAYRDQLLELITNYKTSDPETQKERQFGYKAANVPEGDTAAFEKELAANVYVDDRDRARAIYKVCTLPEEIEDHKIMVAWQLGTFDHAPVVAAAALFTAISNDVRSAEVKALEVILSRVRVPNFDFDVIDPLAYAPTAYLNVGDSMQIRAMLAAYNTKDLPEIRYRVIGPGFDSTQVIETNQQIPVKASAAGKYTYKGEISVKEKGVKKWKPWDYSYTVGQPMGVISAYELNVLYIGYPNKIQATASGYPKSSVSCSGCSISPDGSGGKYVARVTGGKTATVTVFGETEDGTREKAGDMKFRIFPMPTPTIFFGSQSATKSNISRANARNFSTLQAKYEDSPLNVNWDVTSFEMLAVKNGRVIEMRTGGNRLTGEMKAAINSMGRGSSITFTNIKAKSSLGSVKELGSAAWKVQ